MRSLKTSSGYSETTSQFVSRHSETSAGELSEVAAMAGSCSRLPAMAYNMMEYALSILIVIFPYNSNKPRPQTESCLFSNLGDWDSGNFLPAGLQPSWMRFTR